MSAENPDQPDDRNDRNDRNDRIGQPGEIGEIGGEMGVSSGGTVGPGGGVSGRPLTVWLRRYVVTRFAATAQRPAYAHVQLTGRGVSYHGPFGLLRRVVTHSESHNVPTPTPMSDQQLVAAAKALSVNKWR
jgi:hypothetical protein